MLTDQMKNKVKFESDDLILNRYDLHNAEYDQYSFESEAGEVYEIAFHLFGKVLYINVWGKTIPEKIMDAVVNVAYDRYPEALRIRIIRMRNNYRDQLDESTELVLYLPNTEQELMDRMKHNGRYNFLKKKSELERLYGEISFLIYDDAIPDTVLNAFFKWKEVTHSRHYDITPKEYIEQHHVTGAILMMVGGNAVSVLLFCLVNDVAYLENLSYDVEYERFSPGFIVYQRFLCELITRSVKTVFLGGGRLQYKTRFKAVRYTCYSGYLCTNRYFVEINNYFKEKGVSTAVIYGYGKRGRRFMKMIEHFELSVVGIIDQNSELETLIPHFHPSEDLPDADIALITMEEHVNEVEELLNNRYNMVVYFDELLL